MLRIEYGRPYPTLLLYGDGVDADAGKGQL